MHARMVEHLPALRHAQEARALFKRLRAELRHLQKLLSAGERTVFLAEGDDVLRRHIRQARDLPQE